MSPEHPYVRNGDSSPSMLESGLISVPPAISRVPSSSPLAPTYYESPSLHPPFHPVEGLGGDPVAYHLNGEASEHVEVVVASDSGRFSQYSLGGSSGSKFLVLPPRKHPMAVSPDGSKGIGRYLTEPMSHRGNIVLIAADPLDLASSDHDIINNNVAGNGAGVATVLTAIGSNDEELTSLNWLHDRDLLKGINLSCNKNQQGTETPRKTPSCMSPTSDFVEDSSVSEDYSTPEMPQNLTTKTETTPMTEQDLVRSPSSFKSTAVPLNLTEKLASPKTTNGSSVSHLCSVLMTPSAAPTSHYNHKKYLREEYTKQIKQEREEESQRFMSPVNYSTKMEPDYDGYFGLYKGSSDSMPGSSCPSPSTSSNLEPCNLQMDHSSETSETPIKECNGNSQSKVKHPCNVPYDPLLHTNSKPPYSFSCLIFMAIEDSTTKALPVKEIYSWITTHFPYFKTAPNGWKNSVRHNLSLNKSFQKVEKAANLGKGSLWMVDEQYRPNLLQALNRSPFHSCSGLEKSVMKAVNSTPTSSPFKLKSSPDQASSSQMKSPSFSRLPNPQHFPFLAKRLAAMDDKSDEDNFWRADSIDDVNAATAMLALKHGPRIYSEVYEKGSPPVVSLSPNEDHTYSSAFGCRSSNTSDANSNGTSSDAAYESGEEEQRRLAEGADALLNLAGIHTSSPVTSHKRAAGDEPLGPQTKLFRTSSPLPPKKQKPRVLKAKLKRKAAWLR